jgi:recombination protein RecA
VPGGRALKHHASVRLDVRVREPLKDGGRLVGNRIRVRVVKNKVAAPFRSAELDLIFGQGISHEGGLLDLGLDQGAITRTDSGYRLGSTRLGLSREEARQFLCDHPELAGHLCTRLSSALSRGGQAA